MVGRVGKLAAAAALALSVGGLGIGGSSLTGSPVHAAAGGNDAGVSQFCKNFGDQTIGSVFFGIDAPVSQGACVSFIQSYLINQQGQGSSAIVASLCQAIAPPGEEGACVSSFNQYYK